MKILINTGLFLIFLSALAWSWGVRIHPEVLQENLTEWLSPAKEYYRLELTNGKILNGEIVSKKETGITFKSERVAISFSHNEIAKLTPLEKGSKPLPIAPTQRSWIAWSQENNLWFRYFFGQSQKKQPASCNKSLSLFDALTPSVPVNAYTHAKASFKKSAEARQQNS